MSKFAGFPAGKVSVTPLPDLFFSELLTQIDDLAELKVTLHLYWRLAHHKTPLCLSRSELRADAVLRKSLGALSLDDALQRAVQRQSLLELRTRNKAGEIEYWYFANSESGRRDLLSVREGKIRLRRASTLLAPAEPVEHPNVFTLYEQYIGMLTPLVAEQVQEAAQTYPAEWLGEAFGIAAQQDKRSWRYVEAILQRWAREGKDKRTRTARPSQPQPTLKPKRRR